MERLGGYIIFFAIGSAVLSQTNYQFRLMSWMNDMGNGAWVVRAVMLVVGVAMIGSGQMAKKPAKVPSAAQPITQPVQPHAAQATTPQPQPQTRTQSPQPQSQPSQGQPQPQPAQAVSSQPAPAQVIEF